MEIPSSYYSKYELYKDLEKNETPKGDYDVEVSAPSFKVMKIIHIVGDNRTELEMEDETALDRLFQNIYSIQTTDIREFTINNINELNNIRQLFDNFKTVINASKSPYNQERNILVTELSESPLIIGRIKRSILLQTAMDYTDEVSPQGKKVVRLKFITSKSSPGMFSTEHRQSGGTLPAMNDFNQKSTTMKSKKKVW